MGTKFTHLTGTEQASTPATPDTGERRIYFKADGLYMLNDNGTEVPLSTVENTIHPFLLMGA